MNTDGLQQEGIIFFFKKKKNVKPLGDGSASHRGQHHMRRKSQFSLCFEVFEIIF